MNSQTYKMLAVLIVIAGVAIAVGTIVSQHPPERQQSTKAGHQSARSANRLIHENSPYLLQHAYNPVDWWPWCEEALARAKQLNKPIFLSVGYSTCYWCHVMERESFENEEIAAILNEHYIAIKVDRELRPDVDQQFMIATQLMTGRGGWPNSLWLTPDGRAFMAATYLPPRQFKRALLEVAESWTTQREVFDQQAQKVADAIQAVGQGAADSAERPPSAEMITAALQDARSSFDPQHGGFGSAPKFPPHGRLSLLIDQYRRTHDAALLKMITTTLDQMAAGGMRDHLGGGFHRYATDDHWLLPHFEKMLYDNAQLMRIYADAFLITKRASYRAVVDEIFQWLQRDMTSPAGAFYSAIDAESDGVEGAFYVWRSAEVAHVLGPQDGELFAQAYGVMPQGNFQEESSGKRTGLNVLHLADPSASISDVTRAQLQNARKTLLQQRNTRKRPRRDDKILAAWNGLMIDALAYAGRVLDEPRFVVAASAAADFITETMLSKGQLRRSYRHERIAPPGYLDDYAYMAAGLTQLYHATQDDRYLQRAKQLADIILDDFQDETYGGFFFTAEGASTELIRAKNLTGGGNLPLDNGVAAQVLLELSQLLNQPRYEAAAKRTVDGLAGLLWQSPHGTEALLLAVATILEASEPQNQTKSSTRYSYANNREPDIRIPLPTAAVSVFASKTRAAPGEEVRVAFQLAIRDGWHFYGANPDVEFLKPTEIKLTSTRLATEVAVTSPPGSRRVDPIVKQEVVTYEGTVWFEATVRIRPSAEVGRQALEFQLTSQACDATRCARARIDTIALPLAIMRPQLTE